jgi:Kef-type K+ transport system membrane component KefB
VLLLPLFFAFTGLRTQIALVDDLSSLLMCLAIIILATAGKFGGSAVAARFTGMSWTNSLVLGALMNTRGLMELIVLNVATTSASSRPRSSPLSSSWHW